jgi:transcriptional regulator with XRE-family HTH domain
MGTPSERMSRLREHLGMTKADFERFVGVKPRMAWNWEHSRTKCPSPEHLVLLHKKTGVSIQWVVNGEGPMFDEATPEELSLLSAMREIPEPRRKALLKLMEATIESMKEAS